MALSRDNGQSIPRRDFLKHSVMTASVIGAAGGVEAHAGQYQKKNLHKKSSRSRCKQKASASDGRDYNSNYSGDFNNRVAFPMGGMGAGMICLEGTGALSHVSIRNKPEVFNEPCIFPAICIKGEKNIARLLEGPVPAWKIFGRKSTGNGGKGTTYGLPRFREVSFSSRFPFGTVSLSDKKVPIKAEVTGWSPFEPGDTDNACLPVAGLEYRLTNTSRQTIEGVWSFNAKNILGSKAKQHTVRKTETGFIFNDAGESGEPWAKGAFSASVVDHDAKVNCAWFRGRWFDAMTMAWKDVADGVCYEQEPHASGEPSPGASIFVPFKLDPNQSKTITLQLSWYMGQSDQRCGKDPEDLQVEKDTTYSPWYSGQFANIYAVADYWRTHYDKLRHKTERFSACFYDTTLPPEVIEAIAANLTILKSPTVLRQKDGRLWCFEGCCDNIGCCHGTCTHVWNYAQAIPHLFPDMERTLRETEFLVNQDDRGHQYYRSSLPIRPVIHKSKNAASDGQLGGIMKAYREWRISGDTKWLKELWPKIKQSMAYCIEQWDPRHKGVLEEPHHNTYDISFWGPEGMCTSFYLGALTAAIALGKEMGDDVSLYEELLGKGTKAMETELFNGEYFYQKIQWVGLDAIPDAAKGPPEEQELFKREGPKYQYGVGCISDGVLGAWIAKVCGVDQAIDQDKIATHLKSVHKYNLKRDLSAHANPQRPTYACNSEGGLLLCTWPHGGALSLPFVYSNEVWTGIEYQVAAHMCMLGMVDQGLEIVRICRDRYDGRVRNPFNEYECGHWYARAMSSYGLLQGLTGARYDAVDKILYIEPMIAGDFRSFLSTATGYGTVGVRKGKPFIEVKAGKIDYKEIKYQAYGTV